VFRAAGLVAGPGMALVGLPRGVRGPGNGNEVFEREVVATVRTDQCRFLRHHLVGEQTADNQS
jgi:hypothetical protein